MPAQNEFFAELKEWSERKLTIVQKYLGGFTKILGNFSQGDIFYVDGFAGRGTYQGGERGSPVLAAELAERFRTENKQYRLFCINIEKDPNNFMNLETETIRFGNIVHNVPGAFADNIDDVLLRLDNHPTLFFLDDFGICGTEWDAVGKVVKRKAPTDLWVRFDHRTVRRLDGFFDSKNKSAGQKFSNLHHLYGINNLEYLHTRMDGPTPEDRIQNALALYLERLEAIYSGLKGKGFSAAYPITSLDGQRKYHLVFASAHPKAAILASDIVNSSEETYQSEVKEFKQRKSKQLSLFSLDPTLDEIFADKVERLKEDIWISFKGKTIKRSDLHYQIICMDNKKWFGKVRGTHINKALENLKNTRPVPQLQYEGPISRDSTKIMFTD